MVFPLSHEARELMLYADNTQALARQRDAVCASLARHVRRGDYDSAKAPAAFRYLAEAAAKAYAREFSLRDVPWHATFSVAARAEVARALAPRFYACRRAGVAGDRGAAAG